MVKVVKRSVLAGVMILGMSSAMIKAGDFTQNALQVVKNAVTSDVAKDVLVFAGLTYAAQTFDGVVGNVVKTKDVKKAFTGVNFPVGYKVDHLSVENNGVESKVFKGVAVRVGGLSLGVEKSEDIASLKPVVGLPTLVNSAMALVLMNYGPDCLKKRS